MVLSGRGILQTGGQTLQIHKGQMFLLREHEDIFYQADMKDPWYYVWITYGGVQAERCMKDAGFTEGIYVRDCNINPTEFVSVVHDILERPHLKLSNDYYRMGLAYRFLGLAVESWEKSTDGETRKTDMTVDDYVHYAVRFIQSNYASSIKVNDVADYIGINRTYLTSIFKEKMDKSPQEFLMQVRMSKACELLLNTDVPINVVAREVGYEDQMAFSKMFRKKNGLSPDQYRKKHHDEHTIS